MRIMPNTNKKLRADKQNGHRREDMKQNLKYKYLMIEKEFRYTVGKFSAQHFEINNILKIIFMAEPI